MLRIEGYSFGQKSPKFFTFKKIGRKIIIFCARRIKIKYKFPRFFELDGKPPPAPTEVSGLAP